MSFAVFLDIDGVLNSRTTCERTPDYHVGIDDLRVEDLEEIYSCELEERFMEKSKNPYVAKEYMKKYVDRYFNQENKYRNELLKRVRGSESNLLDGIEGYICVGIYQQEIWKK